MRGGFLMCDRVLQEHWLPRPAEVSNACILTPCGCQGVVNLMEIQQSALGCMLAPRTGAKYSFPEDFWKFPMNAKMRNWYEGMCQEECECQGVL